MRSLTYRGLILLFFLSVASWAQMPPTGQSLSIPPEMGGDDLQKRQMEQIVARRMDSLSPEQRRIAEIYQKARSRQVDGPQIFDLDEVAELHLPLGYSFVHNEDARALMALLGNFVSNDLLGMIVATKDVNMDWFLVLSHSPIGYISDKGGKSIDAGALLETITAQLNLQNQQQSQGAKIASLRWLIEPKYDPEQHTLSWLLQTTFAGDLSNDPKNQGINIQHLILGRSGFISANLATSVANLEFGKSNAKTILKNIRFNPGQRYQDFQKNQDRLSTITLTELISGIPSEKLANPTGDVQNTVPSPGREAPRGRVSPETSPPHPSNLSVAIPEGKLFGGYGILLWSLALLVLLFVVVDGLRKPTTRVTKNVDVEGY